MSEIVFPSTKLLLSEADAHKTPVHCLINVVASATILPHKPNYIPSLGIVKHHCEASHREIDYGSLP